MFKPNSAEELWYVIEVKHKFINGNYQNEIKAVRFLAGGKEDRERRDTPRKDDRKTDEFFDNLERRDALKVAKEKANKAQTSGSTGSASGVGVSIPGSTQATENSVDPIITPGKL